MRGEVGWTIPVDVTMSSERSAEDRQERVDGVRVSVWGVPSTVIPPQVVHLFVSFSSFVPSFFPLLLVPQVQQCVTLPTKEVPRTV